MKNTNLEILKKTIYVLSFICLIIQIILSKTIIDYTSIFLIFFSNIIVSRYCFSEINISKHPISSNIIFVSYFINLGGALYFKSITGEPITAKLNFPIDTIFFLILFHFVVIFTHFLYKKILTINTTQDKLSNFFLKHNLMKISDNNFLIFIGSVSVIFRIFNYDLNIAIGEQTLNEYPNLFRDIVLGITIFSFAPFLIIFTKKFYKLDDDKNYIKVYIIFFSIIAFLSMSIGSRSMLFDLGLFIFFILFIYFQQNHIQLNQKRFIKILLISVLFFPLMSFLDVVSKAYLLDRSKNLTQTPIENFSGTIKRIVNYGDTKKELKNLIIQYDYYQNESYYENTILNRFNILLVNDNINYVFKNISKRKIEDLKKLERNKIISIIPQPIISIFNKNFIKTDYLRISMGSYIYRSYDAESSGSLSIGSFPFALIHYFNILWPIYLILLSMFIFFVFDSFYHKQKKIISPIAFFLFYATAAGMLNIFTSSEISKLISYTIRITPQTIILYYILFKIYSFLTQKKN